jgi:hypothetical protein
VVEEHDSFSAVMSAVEAGTGVAIATGLWLQFWEPPEIFARHS